MAKRFSDSTKWSDVWFSELLLEDKLTYIYLLDSCDQVGVWEPNYKLADFNLGFKNDWKRIMETLGEGRVFLMPNGSWWLKKFCGFQYGELKEESKSQTTQFYINLLKKHRLWIAYTETIDSPKDKRKEKDYIIPKDFLKKKIETTLDELNMKSGLSKEDFDFCLTQWSLAADANGWEYSTNEDSDLKRLRAGFEKWLGTWLKNLREKKTNGYQKKEEPYRPTRIIKTNG